MASYDPGNVFAKILRGELPSHKVYEDERSFAFLDIDPDDLAHLAGIVQKVAKAGVRVFAADGVTVHQFSETAGGQVVFHLHFHVIPRRNGVALKPPASFKEEPAVLSDQALKLAAAMRQE